MARYLRQLKSGYIYHHTPTLAKRNDMVPYDPEHAERRIEALKRSKEAQITTPEQAALNDEEAAEAIAKSKELTALENEMFPDENETQEPDLLPADRENEAKLIANKNMTDEDIEEVRRQRTIEKDPQVIQIMGMNRKAQVEEYLLREFAEEVEIKEHNLQTLKNLAINKRTERLFEQ